MKSLLSVWSYNLEAVFVPYMTTGYSEGVFKCFILNTVKQIDVLFWKYSNYNSFLMFQQTPCRCSYIHGGQLREVLAAHMLFLNLECVRVLWNAIRLKRRRQPKQCQSEKAANEQNPAIISCPDIPNEKKTDLQRITSKPPAGSGETRSKKLTAVGTYDEDSKSLQIP